MYKRQVTLCKFNGISTYCNINSKIRYENKEFEVASLDNQVFKNCTTLTEITIPNSITNINNSVFFNCPNLKTINVLDDNPYYSSKDGVLFNKNQTELIYIPSGIKIYDIPNTVTGIANKAIDTNTILNVYPGSYAEEYLKENEISHNIINSIIDEKVELNKSTLSLKIGECEILQIIQSSDDINKLLTWASSNPSVASVTSTGVVKGISAGTATIAVKTSNGKTATCKVTVKNPTLSLNYTSKTLNKGSSFTLKGTPTPSATVAYKSSNTKVATVSSTGVVKGVNGGKATITISANGISKTCIVTVPYTITYKLNGGTNNKNNPSNYYGKTIKLANPTRKGYTFSGWYSNSNYETKVTNFSTGNKTLYAKWTATKYAIKYNMNGGTNNKSNPASYYITSNTITLKKPTRKGYIFSGWYSDSKFKTKVTKIVKGNTGNKTLYAKWIKVTVAKAKTPTLTNVKGKKLKITYKATTGVKGYQIQYSTNKNFSKATSKNLTGTSATYTLKKGKTYYVRVRAYKLDSTGSKVYGSWSTVKNKKITK